VVRIFFTNKFSTTTKIRALNSLERTWKRVLLMLGPRDQLCTIFVFTRQFKFLQWIYDTWMGLGSLSDIKFTTRTSDVSIVFLIGNAPRAKVNSAVWRWAFHRISQYFLTDWTNQKVVYILFVNYLLFSDWLISLYEDLWSIGLWTGNELVFSVNEVFR
jgi:hypothetical protein